MTKHLNLIRKIVWSFHRTTGIEWSELFSEACLAYWLAIQSFDSSSKNKESTWVFICIQNQLKNFIKYEVRNNRGEMSYLIREWIYTAEEIPEYEFFQLPIVYSSNDVNLIIQMVLQNSNRYNRKGLSNKNGIGNIRKDLRTKKKWTFTRINQAMQNLRLELLN